MLYGLLAEAVDLGPKTFAVMRDVMTEILRHDEERGELVPAELIPRKFTLPGVLLRNEIPLTRNPVSEKTIEEIVDDVFPPIVRASREQ